eukprot:228294-Alexandrium_andersonii.AAC.1
MKNKKWSPFHPVRFLKVGILNKEIGRIRLKPMRRQLTSSPSRFKDIKRWAAVRDLVFVVDVKGFWRCAVSGGGVFPPCPFERIQDARRRSEE